MKILITGAAGFIGRYLMHALSNNNESDRVIGIDYPDGDLAIYKNAFSLMAQYRPDVTIHLAAKVGRLFGEQDAAETVRANTLATILVAKAASHYGSRLIYVSTSEAFGDNGKSWVAEDSHGALPHNLYGLTKRWGEEAARLYAGDGLQIIRPSMPYGPGLPAGYGRAAVLSFLWAAYKRQPITVYKNTARCLCWIGDLISGMKLVVEHNQIPGNEGIWTVGRDDNETSMLEVAQIACDIAKAPYSLIQEVDSPKTETLVKRLNTTRLANIGWAPKVDLIDGMLMTYKALKSYHSDGMPQTDWKPVL